MKRSCVFCAVMCLVVPSVASGRIWLIHPDGIGHAPTIQAGIDSAVAGDEVVLEDGTFTGPGNRDIDFKGKALTVRSTYGNPNLCVVDCEGTPSQPHRGFHFHSGEGSGSILQDVTIRNGLSTGDWPNNCGAGVLCYNSSSPTIANCVISGCRAHDEGLGGAIYCLQHSSPRIESVTCSADSSVYAAVSCEYWSEPTLNNCTIIRNKCIGVYCYLGSPTISDCVIARNASYGIYMRYSSPSVTRCTLVLNDEGIVCGEGSSPSIEYTIIAFSTGGSYPAAVRCYNESSTPFVSCCNFFGNQSGSWGYSAASSCMYQYKYINGNFSEDPRFCDIENDNYYLQECSPCLLAGTCGRIGALDQGCACGGEETTDVNDQPAVACTWGAIKSMYR